MLAIEASIVKRAVFLASLLYLTFLYPKLNLNSMKGVFDLASNRTQQLFVGNSLCRELLSPAVAFRSRISYSFRICTIALFHTEISGIADYFPVIGRRNSSAFVTS